jgi:hypothetical protein
VLKHKTKLSNVAIDEHGQLVYAQPPFRLVLKMMVKDFPIMCWYMLIGMMLLLSRSVWAIAHPSITVTYKADILIYMFLLFISFSVIVGLVFGSYYFAKSKLKSQ